MLSHHVSWCKCKHKYVCVWKQCAPSAVWFRHTVSVVQMCLFASQSYLGQSLLLLLLLLFIGRAVSYELCACPWDGDAELRGLRCQPLLSSEIWLVRSLRKIQTGWPLNLTQRNWWYASRKQYKCSDTWIKIEHVKCLCTCALPMTENFPIFNVISICL